MEIFYTKWKKFNEIQLTKIKMDFNNLKMKYHPPPSLEIYGFDKYKTNSKYYRAASTPYSP